MITDRLHARAAQASGPPFVVVEATGREVSYAEMSALVRSYGGRLHGLGVRAGQRVALLCGNRLGFLVAWFALGELGAVSVPLNVGLVGDGLRHTLTQSGAALLLIEPALLDAKRDDLALLQRPPPVELLDERAEAVTDDPGPPGPPASAADAPNSILFTSGTTGLPKGAVIPHGAYLAAGTDMAASLGLEAEDRILVFLPLFHANPQMYAVMSVLEVGATLILQPRFSASGFFEAARRHRATGFTYVGTVLSILDKRYPEAVSGHGLRWCVGGGAPAAVWRAVEERFGIAVRELYGMTETGGWVSMNTGAATRFGSVGRARRGVRLAIAGQGDDEAAGQPGEITARAEDPATFFSGYWNDPASTAATLRDGWLHTGDRGWLDADGFLFFAGRMKELVRRAGEMISPVEIEVQLVRHPAIRECAVIGVPDEILGEELAAVIVADRPIPAAELLAFLAGRLPAHMLPRFVSFVDALPKTETEKIKRHELRQLMAVAIDLKARASGVLPSAAPA
ncbi:MAG: AMP-binding protein [Janthinobacterium lividum]